MSRNLLCACFLLLFAPAWPEDSTDGIFSEADRFRTRAESVNAPLLSPVNYSRGLEAIDAARNAFAKGRNPERIQGHLERATQYFQQSISHSETASTYLAIGIESREAAMAADAMHLAPQDWAEGEKQFFAAARALEKDNPDDAGRYRAQSNDIYRTAELNAIRARYFSEARRLLSEAQLNKVAEHAPRTLVRAKGLLADADAALQEDRYQTDRPRALADQASAVARHAIHIAGIVNSVENGTLTIEDVILDWESPLIDIASALEFEANLSDGYAGTSDEVIRRVRDLHELAAELKERDRQVRGLEDELRELDARLGDASAERTALVRRLEAQARVREQFELVASSFTTQEAEVLRDGDQLILRLVGLTFASNSSELGPDSSELMQKVKTAIDLFPRCDLTIEGHTDSLGNTDRNLELSVTRARSIMNYIVEEMRIPEYRIKATGYGDSRPIANNKTEEGRAKNRRIDLIIVPNIGTL